MEEEKKLMIVDANALLYRSFHALPPLATKNGEQTGAIYGFLLTLFKAIKDLKPDYIAVCFDSVVPTFRHQRFKEYKAQRPKTPDELILQIQKTKEILSAFNISVFEKNGFEADDLIATISAKIRKEKKDIKIYIVTGDLDLLQIIDKKTKIYTLGKGIKESVVYDQEKVVERFGITPKQMVNFKALRGDPSDNIPGVLGIGTKTASDLLKKFENLDNLYRLIENQKAEIKPRIREILLKNKEQVFFSLDLVAIKDNVPIDFSLEKCRFGEFNRLEVEKVLKKFEFHSILNRLDFDSKKGKIKDGQKNESFNAFKQGSLI